MSSKRKSDLIALIAAVAVWAGASAAASEAAPPATATPDSAQALIEKTAVEVLAILRDKSRTTAQRRLEIEKIAHARFDFRTMARLVLASDWKRLDAAKRDEFVDQFTTYLANDYGSRIDRYQQQDVKVMGEQPKPRGDVAVRTKIVGGESDGAIVDYRMRKTKEGEWRIIDVVIEGISLVANFRDQFREVIARGGPEALLQKLKEKNAAAAEA
ncbi:MAG TPA: ABC transporter substrate-binding protein [Myxococcota bacterium]|nr:ABC transporter substrate-binding protein [Myxococcota bacterium]